MSGGDGRAGGARPAAGGPPRVSYAADRDQLTGDGWKFTGRVQEVSLRSGGAPAGNSPVPPL